MGTSRPELTYVYIRGGEARSEGQTKLYIISSPHAYCSPEFENVADLQYFQIAISDYGNFRCNLHTTHKTQHRKLTAGLASQKVCLFNQFKIVTIYLGRTLFASFNYLTFLSSGTAP